MPSSTHLVRSRLRVAAVTAVALVALAANSLLCRLALAEPDVDYGAGDALLFTGVRMIAGAIALAPFVVRSWRRGEPRPPWRSAVALFAYAIAFSFAYLELTTGTGALLLFGAVQVTVIGAALASGERLRVLEWAGAAAALSGLVWLVMPGVTAPSLTGALLMIGAGIAWGVCSLLGRRPAGQAQPAQHAQPAQPAQLSPTAATAWSFVRAAPLALLCFALAGAAVDFDFDPRVGRLVLLASASGAITSGLGYVVWYAALRSHTATSAALVQLTVPVLAAMAGVVVLDESVTIRLAISVALVIGGVATAVRARNA